MTYITLLKLDDKSIEAIRYLEELKTSEEITIKEICFVFSQCDAAIIFEVINNKIALNFIIEIEFATNYTVETMVAISTKKN